MLVFLFLIFVAVRVFFILTFPPFTDESLYIRWGMLMVDNPAYHWASITSVSRQPLAFWLFGLGAVFFRSPLIGARLVVLLCNIPSFFFVTALTKKLSGAKAVLVSAAILAFTPLFILTQSLALMDGLLFAVATGLIWLIFTRDRRLTIPELLITGIALAAALWMKTTALFIVFLSLLSIAYMYRKNGMRNRFTILDISVTCVVASVLLLPLVLRPDIRLVFEEPGSFLSSGLQPAQLPSVWGANAVSVFSALLLYIGPVLFFLLFIPLKRAKLPIQMIWFVLPVACFTLLSKSVRLRYGILGSAILIPFLSGIMVKHLDTARRRTAGSVYWLAVILYCLYFVVLPSSFFMLFPSASGERDYALSWPSGYGIPDLVRYIDAAAKYGEIVIAVPDSPGNPSDFLLSNYYFSERVRIIFVTITSPSELRKIEPLTRKVPVFLATRESLVIPSVRPYLTEIVRFPKPGGLDSIRLYRISF